MILGAAGWLACDASDPPRDHDLGVPAISDPAVAATIAVAAAEVRRRPDDAEAHLALAVCYDANGLHLPAAETYEEVLAHDPDHARAWYHLARMRFELGHFDQALEAVGRAGRLAPDHAPAAWRAGLWLLDAGRTAEARAAFERADAIDPRDPGGRLGLARLALLEDRFEEAAFQARRVIGEAPDLAYAHFLLGSAARALGDEETARQALARGASEGAPWFDPWEQEVREQRVGFQVTKARARREVSGGGGAQDLSRVRALLAEHPDDIGLLGALLEGLVNEGDVVEAVAAVEAAIARQPDHPRLQLLAGRARELAADLDGALAHTERAIALHPGFGPAHAQLGRLRSGAGDVSGAIEAYSRAVSLGESSPALLLDLGVMQRIADRGRDAVVTFERAARQAPDLFEAQLFLSRARGEVGELAGAREALESARALSPGHPHLQTVEARLASLELLVEGGG